MATKSETLLTDQTPSIVTCVIKVDDQEVSKTHQIVSITVQHEINKISSAHLVINDGEASKEDFEISSNDEFVPGKKIGIELGYEGNNEVVFSGIVITNSHKINEDCAELNIDCKNETEKMTVNKSNRHFKRNILDSDVIQQLLDENDIQVNKIDTSTVKHEQLMQSNVSDWDFMISRVDLAEMICLTGNDGVLVKKPELNGSPVLTLTYGKNIMEFNADMDARLQTTSVKTLTWDFKNQEVRTVENSDTGIKEEGGISSGKLAQVNDKPLELRTASYLSEDAQKSVANAKKLRQQLSKIKAKVKYLGQNDVQPGDYIELKGVGKNFNGNAFVTAIQHEYTDGCWITEATLGWNEQFFTEQTSPYHAASATGQASTIQGLQIAVVTNITDDEGEYRVQVKLPVVNNEEEGLYARVATLDAGKDRGTFFRPELGDEVVVGFINDDPANPVILGMLHSSAHAAPLEPEDSNDKKGYVSRSGIKMIFDDGQKIIRIETPGNRVFELDDNAGSISLQDGDGNKINIANNKISIEAVQELEIKSGGSISISAHKVTIEGDSTLNLEGGSTNLKGSGTTVIKGSMVKIN